MNEYGLSKLPGVVSMTKLRNDFARKHPRLAVQLKNIRVNGQLQGCNGFVADLSNGRVAYVSTDVNHGMSQDALYRNTSRVGDYRGGRNRFCAPQDLVDSVAELLRSGDLV